MKSKTRPTKKIGAVVLNAICLAKFDAQLHHVITQHQTIQEN